MTPNSSTTQSLTSSISLLSTNTSDSPIILRSNSNPPEPVPITNLLATGLGFGLNVSGDSSSLTLCKADGVAVYLKRAATLILSHILGPKVFGEGLSTWEQHVVENVKRWNEQQALLRSSKNNENEDDNDNEYAQIQSSISSPMSPSKQMKNRSITPGVTSSPISSTSTSTSTPSSNNMTSATPFATSPIRR